MKKVIIPPHNKISVPVASYKEIQKDVEEMIELIERNDFTEGIWKQAYALSHSQVSDEPKTFFVVNHTDPYIKKNFKSKVIINPEILEKEDEIYNREGCMSTPYRQTQKVKRFNKIKVSYYTIGWFGRLKKRVEIKTGLVAFIFLHEAEHFNGKY